MTFIIKSFMSNINFKNFEEVKSTYPINSLLNICGKTIQITGYYFDTDYWWPINVVEGFTKEIEEYFKNDL